MEVKHDEAANRFTMDLDGKQALLDYLISGTRVFFTHTEVPKEFEGRGIAGKLVGAALEWARSQSLAVVPSCPFVVTWVRRHPEWVETIDPGWRDKVRR